MSAEQMADFLGEAMMKKQESNLGLLLYIFREEVPLCCEIGDGYSAQDYGGGILARAGRLNSGPFRDESSWEGVMES